MFDNFLFQFGKAIVLEAAFTKFWTSREGKQNEQAINGSLGDLFRQSYLVNAALARAEKDLS